MSDKIGMMAKDESVNFPTAKQEPYIRHRKEDGGKILKLYADAILAQNLADEQNRLVAGLASDTDELEALSARSRSTHAWQALLRSAVAAAAVPLMLAPWFLVRRSQSRREAKDRRTCPRCLAVDKLTVEPVVIADDRYPDPERVTCEKCRYTFRKSYLDIGRLCIPPVGVRSSGKTHTLVKVYEKISNTSIETDAGLKIAPSTAD